MSIIIAVWNQLGYTKLAVESILRNSAGIPFELIIIDNGSRPEVKQYFDGINDKAPLTYIRNDRNLGPIRAINQGIAAARYDYIMVIHNDVIIMDERWLQKIAEVMDKDPKIGIAGLAGRKEIYKNGCVNESSLRHNLQNEDLNEPMDEDVSDVAVVDGLCFTMRRQLLERIKGLDESYGFMHCYDLDVSLASIAAGYRNVVVNVEAMHVGNGGRSRRASEYKEYVKDDYGLLKKNCRILSDKWRHILPLKV
ncbi:MAG: glycosyltransferase [Candidatus Omnitrophica bacterium]|nr:glycosyltransferase [Candidatus Omnitrophota bacterium]